MRLDVNKILFFGHKEAKSSFFQKAQELGIIEFIEKKSEKRLIASQKVLELERAIKILRKFPKTFDEDVSDFSRAEPISSVINNLDDRLQKLDEKMKMTALEIERIKVYGSFSLEDIRFIEEKTGLHFLFSFSKMGAFEKKELPPETIHVGSDSGLDYFLTISKEKVLLPRMQEIKIESSLQDLKEETERDKIAYGKIYEELKGFEKYDVFLHKALIHFINEESLDQAKENAETTLENHVFVIEGFVPEGKESALFELRDKTGVFFEKVSIEADLKVPTYLENKGLGKVGEDLVHIYDTPSTSDNDPSLWVLFAFAFFFAIIVQDGGYGLVFLLASLYMHFKVKTKKEAFHRFKKLAFLLSLTTVAWGLLTGSFFGLNVAYDHPLRKMSLMQKMVEWKAGYHIERKDSTYYEALKAFPELAREMSPAMFLKMGAKKIEGDDVPDYILLNKFFNNIMLESALLIGVIHIILSMLRTIRTNYSHLGWILVILGGYLYIPYYLGATSIIYFVFGLDPKVSAEEGIYLVQGGFFLAVALSIFQHKWMGFLEVASIIQIFSDILSYLRLYALALAGGIVSSIINDTAASMWLIFAIPIILVGHFINIVLSVVGGVIHGLRLNFLEWYHYSFEGGGKLFRPLSKVKIE